MAQVAVGPADAEPGLLEDGGAPLERLRARRPEGEMAHARGLGRGELERVMLVVVPAAEVDGVAAAAALREAHDVDEEVEALLRFRRQQLDVRQVREVERTKCRLHGCPFS